ncbi:MAG: hypothetical protein WAJ91_12160, partial [Rhodoplanes sp.]
IDGSEREANVSERWKGSTIAFRMTREQTFELAAILLVVTQQAEIGQKITVTIHRDQKRSDGVFPIQVHAESRS